MSRLGSGLGMGAAMAAMAASLLAGPDPYGQFVERRREPMARRLAAPKHKPKRTRAFKGSKAAKRASRKGGNHGR